MRNIAIVRRNGLGDLLCAMPLALYLKQKDPLTKITFFVDQRNAPLIPFLPILDEVIILPPQGNKYFNLIKTGVSCRKQKFDLAISAKTSPMKLMNIFLFALGAKQRIAYVDGHWSKLLVNHPLQYHVSESKKMHQALKGLHLVDASLQEVPSTLFPQIRISSSLKKQYAGLIGSLKSPYLVLSASTTRDQSRLDPKRYAKIANHIAARYDFSVIVIAQPQDKERAQEIKSHLKVSHQLHFPRNFDAFMVLLNACDLYFVGDGGMAHIGAGLGKSGIVLFGETNPIEWHPLSTRMTCLYHPLHVNSLFDQEIVAELEKKAGDVCGRCDL